MLHWNMAGAFSHFGILKLFFLRNPKGSFSVYDGPNLCKWNGGRINRNIWIKNEHLDFYKTNNIEISLTFSNPIIDLNDKMGNKLLELCNFGNNSIILVNDLLREYIRNKFPNYKLKFSVTGTRKINVPMKDEDILWYKKLEKYYDLIVPRFEHIFDKRFLELNISKYEIMTNDTCIYNCKFWGEHFDKDAEINRLFNNPWKELGEIECKKIEECWINRL